MGAGIKDVAKLAGVSPATVSRTLSGGIVSDALKQRVMKAVAEIGYRPNLAARRLRAQKSDTIGLIIADIRNPFFTAVARAIDDVARLHGQRVILCNTDENPKQEKAYLDLMEAENVGGIILAATLPTIENPENLHSSRPIMLIDRAPDETLYDAVVIDNRAAGAALVHHLHQRGRRKIACLYGATSATGFERELGYEIAMKTLGLTPNSFPVKHAPLAMENALETMFEQSELPDAIIVTNGLLALTTAQFLQKRSMQVPLEISLASFDDEPWMHLIFGGITTMAQPVMEIATKAFRGLNERIDHPDKPVSQLVLNSKLIIRGSTAFRLT